MYSALQILDKVNEAIAELNYTRQPVGLYAPIEYVLSLGGKRVRPVLMLMAYNLYKDSFDDVMSQALAMETYHNYTLLHDDLMDRSDRRRGMPTVHVKWDENTAILSGDAMLVLAYRLLGEGAPDKLNEILALFTQTALEICEGQQYDMEFETRDDVTESEYMEMIRLKTSVLLAASLKMGALLGGAPCEDAEALYEFGIQLGLAFQLKDDFLDVYGDPDVFGKNLGGDILCCKKTYMLIKALERATEVQREDLMGWLHNKICRPDEKIAAVTQLYTEIGVKKVCENKMREYYGNALMTLSNVSVADDRKQELRSFAERLMNREI